MNRDLTAEELERYADGEIEPGEVVEMEQHLLQCARCSADALRIMQMKRSLREVMSDEVPSATLRERVRRQFTRSRPQWWMAAAAAVVAVAFVTFLATRTSSAIPELVDMHVTLLASANPVDVVSTDKHTVKPWFEGRLPFTVPVPDLSSTPFRLIGGRVVYWRGNPAAYLLISKASHRISVFVFRDDMAPRNLGEVPATITATAWHTNGLTFVAVAQVPAQDLQQLRSAFASGP